ncbi:MAG: hypothetical protein ACYC0L_04810, partial [Thermoleophilia bacterium]
MNLSEDIGTESDPSKSAKTPVKKNPSRKLMDSSSANIALGVAHFFGSNWRRILRISLSTVAALLIMGAVITWPLWSDRVLPEEDLSNGITEPTLTSWLTEAPSKKPVFNGRTLLASVDQLTASPDLFKDRLVVVSSLIQGVFRQNGRTIIVFGPDEKTRITAMYPAERKDIELGKEITVAGEISPTGEEVYALTLGQ